MPYTSANKWIETIESQLKRLKELQADNPRSHFDPVTFQPQMLEFMLWAAHEIKQLTIEYETAFDDLIKTYISHLLLFHGKKHQLSKKDQEKLLGESSQ